MIIKKLLQPKAIVIEIAALLSFIVLSSSLVANAATTTVSSDIGEVISLFTTSGTVNVNVTPTSGGLQTINDDVVTISTNDSNGYTLQLGETTATTTLTDGSNTIAASAGTFSSPVAEVVNTWGYNVAGEGGFGSSCASTCAASDAAISGSIKFAAVPASGSPSTIADTSTTATNSTTDVWYGVAINTTVPTGTYTNSVTYTATTN